MVPKILTTDTIENILGGVEMMFRTIKDYLKARKNSVWVKLLIASRAHYISLKNRCNFERFMYASYYIVCQIIAPDKKQKDYTDLAKDFKQSKIAIVENMLNEDEVNTIFLSFNDNLRGQNLITAEDILTKPKPTKFTVLKDRIVNNLILYYGFPGDYLSQCLFVRHPLNSITGLREAVEKKISPRLNALMGCKTEIVRAWAYKTLNKDGVETDNHNNTWHSDGDVHSAIKCIVYLNNVDRSNGPFCYIDIHSGEVVTVTGKSGTAIFFKSSMVRHQGSATLENDRYCFSLLSHPSRKNRLPSWDVAPDFIRKLVPFLPCSSKVHLP